MIRVTVDLVPFGFEHRKRTLGIIQIANVGGDRNTGHYNVTQLSRPSEEGTCRVVKKGEVNNHPRLRKSVWNLIAKALRSVGHENV